MKYFWRVLLAAALLLAACRGSGETQEQLPSRSAQPTLPATRPGTRPGARPGTSPGESPGTSPGSIAATPTAEEPIIGSTSTPATSAREITVPAADGLLIHGTFYPARGEMASPAVLLLHMNGRTRADWQPFATQLAGSGFSALAVDMRAHGETGGARDWDLAASDLRLVYDYMTALEQVDETRTAIVGASIGANMALVTAAAESGINSVVLLSPGLDYFGVTTEGPLAAYGERPLLIVASEDDPAAAASSRTLADIALGDVDLQIYDNAGHGTAMLGAESGLDQSIIEWLGSHLPGEGIEQAEALPAPTLFDNGWGDRAPFVAGLVAGEAQALEMLPAAPEYHLDLKIAPDLLSVSGKQEVHVTNQEDVALQELYFYLYPNLLGGQITIEEVTVNGAIVEPAYLAERIVLRVPLAEELPPGTGVVVGLNYRVSIPTEGGSNYGVFAAIDGVLALAHFYPQLAVYDESGWNTEIPPPNADVTHADAAFYLVRVAAPEEQVLVASGVEVASQEENGLQIRTFAAGPARDFYLASSERYVVTSQRLGETIVNSYGFAEFAEQNELVLTIAVHAMTIFGERLGTYPYTEFDLAPTPNLALGVEYPGVAVIRSELYDPQAAVGGTPSAAYIESTVVHEAGHQWFYNVVGNDQIDEPWLDEALTQYITYLYHVEQYGTRDAEAFRGSFFRRWDRVQREEIPVGLPAGAYSDREYGAIVYGRGPLFFEALSDNMGQENFDAFLRAYYQQNKWQIATGAELTLLAEHFCGCDLGELFAQWGVSPVTLD